MARDHGRILCRIWTDEEFKQRSKGAQWMYMMLLSQQGINHAGVLPLTIQRWANCSPGTTTENINQYLYELAQHRYVFVDHDTEELLVRSFIRNDGVVKQPNTFKAALRQAGEVLSKKLRTVLAGELRRLGREDADQIATDLVGTAVLALVEVPVDPIGEPPVEPQANPSGGPSDPMSEFSGVGEGESLASKLLFVVGSVGESSQAKPARGPKGIRLPEDWQVTESLRAWSAKSAPDVQLERETEQFRDYWLSKAGRDAVKVDWARTWQRWMRTAQERLELSGKASRGQDTGVDPESVLGRDTWVLPTPPAEVRDGPPEHLAAWATQQRADRLTWRQAEAKRVLELRSAA